MWKRITLAGALGLGACAVAGDVQIMGQFAPASPEAARLRTITVLPFGGDDGPSFADLLTAELQNASLEGQRYFQVLSYDDFAARGGLGARRDPVADAIDYGRRTGVEAVYFGEVTGYGVDETPSQEERTRCLKTEGLFNCAQEEEYTVDCIEYRAVYSVRPEVVDVASGVLAYAEAITETGVSKVCADPNRSSTSGSMDTAALNLFGNLLKSSISAGLSGVSDTSASGEQLLARARMEAIQRVRRAVAPFEAVMQVDFRKQPRGLDADGRQKFANALAYAMQGRMDRACGDWGMLAAGANANNIDLIYNLGVCAESRSDFETATANYMRADALSPRPDRQISAALDRARSQVKTGQRNEALQRPPQAFAGSGAGAGPGAVVDYGPGPSYADPPAPAYAPSPARASADPAPAYGRPAIIYGPPGYDPNRYPSSADYANERP